MTNHLTAIILTHNEEKLLEDCLKSVSFADEIIIIDDNSIDNTLHIAKKYNATIYPRTLDTFANQRNFACSKVNTTWALFIDADERVPEALQKEILSVIT